MGLMWPVLLVLLLGGCVSSSSAEDEHPDCAAFRRAMPNTHVNGLIGVKP